MCHCRLSHGAHFKFFDQIVEEAGGCRSANCGSFLSDDHEYDEAVGIVFGSNSQQHIALLIPVKPILASSTIMELVHSLAQEDLLQNPRFRVLVDIETPSQYEEGSSLKTGVY